MKTCLLFLPLLLLSACCSPCSQYPRAGAEEFVIDSYKIREGKFSILELEGVCSPPISAEMMEPHADQIHDDDVLSIALYHPTREDLIQAVNFVGSSTGYRVRSGAIYLPNLGPVAVAGLTLAEARDRIEEAYREEISNVDIFLEYKERLGQRVELIGMVRSATVGVDGRRRLFEVLSLVRLPENANLFQSYVVRDGHPLPVDMYRLVHLGDMSQNIVMQGGDKIYIASPNETRVMVMGEVETPRVLSIPSGSISVREALVACGGIPFTGDKRFIQVIRGNIACPKIYTLNWHHLVHLPNDSLLLMPGDTVYVSSKAITDWNRFISQLLPSFAGVTQAGQASRIVGAPL